MCVSDAVTANGGDRPDDTVAPYPDTRSDTKL